MRLAGRGLRNMDTGEEAVTDADELAALRRQARKVHLEAVALAVVLTAAVVAL